MIKTAGTQIETDIIAAINKQAGRRLSSGEWCALLHDVVAKRAAAGEISRTLARFIRLTIKGAPYAPETASRLVEHDRMLRAWASGPMAEIVRIASSCNAISIPLPVIFSCEKYLAKALDAQAAVKARYFGIEPIVVRGDAQLVEERLDGTILTLPCDDSYEGLPTKIFEGFAFLHALGGPCGILKIDDDLELHPQRPLDADRLAGLFGAHDYLGLALKHVHHDRSWHFGKCAGPVSPVYGKPFRNPWARGALYYVSDRALGLLSEHYLRFPDCLAGELYEDKAVGDVLYQMGIAVEDQPLEPLLGIDTDAPERALVAAE